MFSILAPTSSDNEYAIQLSLDMKLSNVELIMNSLNKLLSSSSVIERKSLLPFLEKAQIYLESGKIDESHTIIHVFAMSSKMLFKPKDLKQILIYSLQNRAVQESSIIPTLLTLCNRLLVSKNDLIDLLDDRTILTVTFLHSSHQSVIRFISKVVVFDPTQRFPFVSAGLCEQLMPSIKDNISNADLLSTLLDNEQSRQYFIQMGYIKNLFASLFDSSFSNGTTTIVRMLYKDDDLINLINAQKYVFEKGIQKQILNYIFYNNCSDETCINAIIVLADIIRFKKFSEFFFPFSKLLELASSRPILRKYILYLIESFSITNLSHFPNDDIAFQNPVLGKDLFFSMYIAYCSYDPLKGSNINFDNFEKLEGPSLYISIICAIQRKKLFHLSLDLSQNPADSLSQELASMNCLLSSPFDQKNIGTLLQNAVRFSSYTHITNTGRDTSDFFFPITFLDWASSEFDEIGVSRWFGKTTSYERVSPETVFENAPETRKSQIITMLNQQKSLCIENQKWDIKCEQIELECSTLIEKHQNMLIDALETKCRIEIARGKERFSKQ